MVDLTYSELASNLSTSTGNSLVNAANAAGDLVCSIYEAYPTGILPSVGRTPISDITDGLLRRLCEPRDKRPTPQQQPFTGGQCPTLYKVNYRVGNGPAQPGLSQLRNVSGPIRGMEVRRSPNNDGTTDVFLLVGPPRLGADYVGEVKVGGSFTTGPVYSIASVERTDGNPDTCGSPSPIYSPTIPPPNVYNNNTTINIGGNSVSVPVTLIPTVFAPVNIFRPELNVDVGGINVNFALDGITFSPSININSPISLPGIDRRPVIPPSKPQKPSNCPEIDLDGIFDRFDDVDNQLDIIERCSCGPDQVIRTQAYGSADSRIVSLPPNTVGVRLVLTSITPKVRVQFGNANAPDVYFVGWASFGNGSPGGERVPISYESNFFFAPPRATAFSYTTTYGSTARLEVVYLEDVV